MAWDTPAILNALVTRLNAVTGLTAQVGIPNSIAIQFGVYVIAGDAEYKQDATGLMSRQAAALIWIVYRTDGNVNAAELAVAGVLDEFPREFYADRTLGGVLEDGQLDMRLAATDQYVTIGGREFRQYQIRVVGRQSEAVSVG